MLCAVSPWALSRLQDLPDFPSWVVEDTAGLLFPPVTGVVTPVSAVLPETCSPPEASAPLPVFSCSAVSALTLWAGSPLSVDEMSLISPDTSIPRH